MNNDWLWFTTTLSHSLPLSNFLPHTHAHAQQQPTNNNQTTLRCRAGARARQSPPALPPIIIKYLGNRAGSSAVRRHFRRLRSSRRRLRGRVAVGRRSPRRISPIYCAPPLSPPRRSLDQSPPAAPFNKSPFCRRQPQFLSMAGHELRPAGPTRVTPRRS